jgi:hypothetical protein
MRFLARATVDFRPVADAIQKLNPLECGGKRSATPLWISFL